jgi:predicted MFS family arabinose efflux permease
VQHGVTAAEKRSPHHAVSLWQATISGCCASLVGIGLARFAYTPLLPAIIGSSWFSASTAAYLGAANLAGYLAGALIARPLAARFASASILRGMMTVATLAFFACSMPVSFTWFFIWRLLSGIAGGAIMVLAATTILPHIEANRRGLAGGAIFAGVGLGIAASGTLVPLLLHQGLLQAWIGLGVLSLVLTLIAWGGWPSSHARHATPHAEGHQRHVRVQRSLRAVYVEYALNAAGLVPHMIFLVDFIARGLRQGLDVGANYWVIFGLGAVIGPVLSGQLADRAGFRPALRLAFLIEVVAVALPAVSPHPVLLIVSSAIVGAFTPGVVPLVLGRVQELLPHDAAAQRAAWSSATTSFALLQAAGAYGLSFIFQKTGNYEVLFGVGSAMMAAALAIDLGMGVVERAPK